MRSTRSFLLAVFTSLSVGVGLVPPSAFAQAAASPSLRELPDFADLVERVGPAVVNIRTTERARGGSGRTESPLLRGPFLTER